MPSSSASATSSRCAGICAALSSARIVTSCPARRALRATSSAALPPPITTTRLPSAGGAPALAARQVVGAVHHPGPACSRAAAGASGAARRWRGTRRRTRARSALEVRRRVAIDSPQRTSMPERDDARDLAVEHGAREPVRRNAVAHQAAELGARFEQRDRVAAPAQMERRRQSRRSAADDRDPLARARLAGGANAQPSRERLVADIALEPADRQRLVEAGAIAGGFARDGGRCARRSRETGCGG